MAVRCVRTGGQGPQAAHLPLGGVPVPGVWAGRCGALDHNALGLGPIGATHTVTLR